MAPLERLRFPVESTRGRRYPETPHPYRTEFQRDRDRLIHARSFRRLEDKTQVFPAGLSDHFRNRLTHTIEVAQVARTVARGLGLNEELTEALALGHDFGHPPFAHAGEEELDAQLRKHGSAFNHNLHALRIVEHFEQSYAMFPGLNLTFEVREGMVKHSMDFERGEYPELDEFLPGLRPPLEAQLIDFADEIAYNTADLDDGLAAGMFTMDDIAASVAKYAGILDTVEMQFPGAPEKVRFLESLRGLIDFLVGGLIEGTWRACDASGVTGVENVRLHPARLACLTEAAASTTSELKQFLHTRVYNAPQLQSERERARALIAALFELYEQEPERLPEPYASQARVEPSWRVACDYIAGMTDGYLMRTAAQLLR
ncbi:MAG TPA: dNTP triphosphohydrolase [Bryobacteraceae bacterium]|nr:dNTP triphosphohydrolase [Bryobacteraceae bacterium]